MTLLHRLTGSDFFDHYLFNVVCVDDCGALYTGGPKKSRKRFLYNQIVPLLEITPALALAMLALLLYANGGEKCRSYLNLSY